MKNRVGFVSNSSSSSFIIFVDEDRGDISDIDSLFNNLYPHDSPYEFGQKASDCMEIRDAILRGVGNPSEKMVLESAEDDFLCFEDYEVILDGKSFEAKENPLKMILSKEPYLTPVEFEIEDSEEGTDFCNRRLSIFKNIPTIFVKK